MKNSILILLVCVMAACTGQSRKQTLEGEVTPDTPFKAEGLIPATKIPLSTEAKPAEGIKYKTVNKTVSGKAPVVIDFTAELPQREIDLSTYPTVEYIKLKHPLSNQGILFIGRDIRVMYPNYNGVETNFSSRAYLLGDRIVAGDNHTGYHAFDRTGKYIYTVASPTYYPDFTQKMLSIKIDTTDRIENFTIQGSNMFVGRVTGWNERMKTSYSLHNVNDQTERGAFKNLPARSAIIDSSTCMTLDYNVYRQQNNSFVSFFEIESGTTLSMVPNGNPNRNGRLNSYSPDNGLKHAFDGKIYLRQAYNDTIYRVESAQTLVPSYILQLGDKKIDVIKALGEDKKGKFIPTSWLETDQFIYIAYTEGEDNPQNRTNGLVTFHHLYYDKSKGELCRMNGHLPSDEFCLKSTSGEIIPAPAGSLQFADGKLYVSYTKSGLKKMVEGEIFASLPRQQQDKMKSLYADLAEGELLMMILK